MPFHSLIIQGIELSGVAGKYINFIQGSTLGHQRYLAIWVKAGYDIENADFLRWLFGVNGNNTQRAGALTVDMLGGHELILMEASVWRTLISGDETGFGWDWFNFHNSSSSSSASPVVISPIVWIIIAAVAAFMAKK